MAYRVECLAEVVRELSAEPVAWILPKIGAEVEIGFGSYSTFFLNDLVHSLLWQLRVFREKVRRDAEWASLKLAPMTRYTVEPLRLVTTAVSKSIHTCVGSGALKLAPAALMQSACPHFACHFFGL